MFNLIGFYTLLCFINTLLDFPPHHNDSQWFSRYQVSSISLTLSYTHTNARARFSSMLYTYQFSLPELCTIWLYLLRYLFCKNFFSSLKNSGDCFMSVKKKKVGQVQVAFWWQILISCLQSFSWRFLTAGKEFSVKATLLPGRARVRMIQPAGGQRREGLMVTLWTNTGQTIDGEQTRAAPVFLARRRTVWNNGEVWWRWTVGGEQRSRVVGHACYQQMGYTHVSSHAKRTRTHVGLWRHMDGKNPEMRETRWRILPGQDGCYSKKGVEVHKRSFCTKSPSSGSTLPSKINKRLYSRAALLTFQNESS